MTRFRLGNAAGDPWTTVSPNKTAASMTGWETQFNASVVDQIDPAAFNTGIYPWFNVKDVAYGATGDGVADDTTPIQTAINAAVATGRGGTVFFPPGEYNIETTLTIIANISLVGSGFGDEGGVSGSPSDPTMQGTTLTYAGSSTTIPMISIKSPTASERIRGVQIKNMGFNGGGNLAYRGLEIDGCSWGVFEGLAFAGFSNDSLNAAVIRLSNDNDMSCQFNRFSHITIGATGTDMCPLLINGVTSSGGHSQNLFEHFSGTFGGATRTADGIRLVGSSDNNIWFRVQMFDAGAETPRIGATGRGLSMTGDGNGIPRNNLFIYWVGSIYSTGGCYGNTISHATAEGFSVEAAATEQINYTIIDNQFGGWYESPKLAIRDQLSISLGSIVPMALAGYTTPVFGSTHDATARWPSINFTNSVKGRAGFHFNVPYHWGDGKVVGIRVFFVIQDAASGAATSRTVQLEVTVGRQAPPTTGFTGISHAEDLNSDPHTINVPDAEDQLMEADLTFATSLTCAGDEFWSCTIDRIGDSGSDTLSTDDATGLWSLYGAMILFEGAPGILLTGGDPDDPEYPRRGVSLTT